MSSILTSASDALVSGTYFSGSSSAKIFASLRSSASGEVLLETAELNQVWQRSQIQVSDRLGSTPRCLSFPDGGSFFTRDHDGVDRLMGARQKQRSNLIHRLESRPLMVVGSLVGIVLILYLGLTVGLPWIAKPVSAWIPTYLNRQIDLQLLYLFDETYFQPTELSQERIDFMTSE